MKKITLLCIGLVPLFQVFAQNNEIPLTTSISRVTVYPDRALISRSGTLPLTAGIREIAIGALPASLDDASIRARGTGSGLKILGVQIKRDFVESAEPAALKELQQSIQKLEQANQDLLDEQNDLNQKRTLLENLSNQAAQPSKNESRLGASELKSLVIYYGEERLTISKRLREIERLRQTHQEEIDRLRGRLNTLQSAQSPKTRKVVVVVEAKKDGQAKIEIDYMVHGASWQPQYDVSATTDSQDIELTSYAIIRQNTGEDWKNISLSLSTARPQQATSLPELTPWVLDYRHVHPPAPARYQQTSPQDKRDLLRSRASALIAGADGTVASEVLDEDREQAVEETAEVQKRGLSAVFNVPGKVDAPSDNQPHRSTISIQKLVSQRTYLAIPKITPGAYVKAEVKNTNAAPLLPGQVNLFMEGDFIGRSHLPMVAPEGTFHLFLGKDDALKVTYKEKVRREDTSGVLNKTRTIRLGYDIEIENFKKDSVTLIVHDQLPVAKPSEIRVTPQKLSPKPEKQEKETGLLEWKLSIDSKKKQTIEAAYEITLPIGQDISGL
ncbi:MAG: mucoidy inhibitor MuiA family protein [Candidatus Methylacidiphilales bacterium]